MNKGIVNLKIRTANIRNEKSMIPRCSLLLKVKKEPIHFLSFCNIGCEKVGVLNKCTKVWTIISELGFLLLFFALF